MLREVDLLGEAIDGLNSRDPKVDCYIALDHLHNHWNNQVQILFHVRSKGEQCVEDLTLGQLSLLRALTIKELFGTLSVDCMTARISPATLSIGDRKSTRLNSSHQIISYAVFCLKKKT